MQIFIGQGFAPANEFTTYIRQESINVSSQLSDPVPTAEFVLEDPGSTFSLDCLEHVVIVDDLNAYPNTTRNLIQDPTFTKSGAKWSPHIPVGSIVYNSTNGTATISCNTASVFDNISLTQTTLTGAILPNASYMLSFLYSISSLSNASIDITWEVLDSSGNITNAGPTSLLANTSGNVAFTATIPTVTGDAFIRVIFALTNLAGTTVGTFVITQPQLERIVPNSGLTYPTPSCIPGAAYCNQLPDLTVVRENRVFGGLSTILKATYDGPNRLYDIQCSGYAILLSKAIVTSNYVNANDNDIIKDLVTTYMSGLLTANSVITLPSANYDQVSWQDITMKDALSAISGATGTNYYVDAFAAVHYQFPGYSQSAIELSDSPDYNDTFPYYDYTYTKDASEMANRIRVDGGTGGASNQQVQPATTETFNGDGSTKTFSLAFLPRSVTSITVGGVAQKIGIAKKDSFSSGYAVLVNKPSQQITFNTAPASGTNNVAVTYTYLSPPSVRVSDASSIGKYGFTLDAKLDDSILVTSGDTYQRGLTELSKYSTPLKSIELKTNYGPWNPGDTVGITSSPDALAGTPFLIQTAKASMLGVNEANSMVTEYALELGAYRPDILHHILHLQKKVKGQSSNTSVAASEYVVAFEQLNYSESIAGSLYSGTISGGGTPPSTNYIIDTFDGRTVSGGWGTASDGINAWSINALTNVNLSVGSGVSVAQWNGSGSQSAANVDMLCGSSQPANVEVLVRFEGFDNFNGGREVGFWTRRTIGTSGYYAAAILSNSGSTLKIQKQVSGTMTTLGTFNITIGVSQFVWVRFRTSGTFIAARSWIQGTTEPTTWGWSGTDSSVSSSGRVGIYVGTPGQVGPVKFGDYSVTAA